MLPFFQRIVRWQRVSISAASFLNDVTAISLFKLLNGEREMGRWCAAMISAAVFCIANKRHSPAGIRR
jgi:hypothetical protein